MKTLAMLTLLLIMSGFAVGQTSKSNVIGHVGNGVLLTFNCSNDPKELVWQKDDIVVNVHPLDKSIINETYVNRTQLFINVEKKNCSLLLLNISTEDAGLYTCHALVSVDNNVWTSKSTEVNLTVSEIERNPEQISHTGENSVTAVSVSVPIAVVMLILAVSLLLILIRRQRRTNTDTDSPAERPFLELV